MAPKRRLSGTVPERQKKIARVLESLGDVTLESDTPMNTREMLSAGALLALNPFPEDRTVFQGAVCGYLEETFGDMAAHLESHEKLYSNKISEAVASAEKASAKMSEEQSLLQQAESVQEEENRKLNEFGSAVEAAANCEQRCAKALAGLEKERARLDNEGAKNKSFADGPYKTMLEFGCVGTGTAKEQREQKNALDKVVKEFEAKLKAEETLLSCMPPTFSKKPEERKGFDDLVLSSMSTLLAARDANLAERVDGNTAQVVEHSKERDDSTAAREKAAAAVAEQQLQFDQAQAKRSEIEVRVDEAVNSMTKLCEQQNELAAEQMRIQNVVAKFSETRLEMEMLVKNPAPAPEPEPAPAPEPEQAPAPEPDDAPAAQEVEFTVAAEVSEPAQIAEPVSSTPQVEVEVPAVSADV